MHAGTWRLYVGCIPVEVLGLHRQRRGDCFDLDDMSARSRRLELANVAFLSAQSTPLEIRR